MTPKGKNPRFRSWLRKFFWMSPNSALWLGQGTSLGGQHACQVSTGGAFTGLHRTLKTTIPDPWKGGSKSEKLARWQILWFANGNILTGQFEHLSEHNRPIYTNIKCICKNKVVRRTWGGLSLAGQFRFVARWGVDGSSWNLTYGRTSVNSSWSNSGRVFRSRDWHVTWSEPVGSSWNFAQCILWPIQSIPRWD